VSGHGSYALADRDDMQRNSDESLIQVPTGSVSPRMSIATDGMATGVGRIWYGSCRPCNKYSIAPVLDSLEMCTPHVCSAFCFFSARTKGRGFGKAGRSFGVQ
jgi:hypothetical protein